MTIIFNYANCKVLVKYLKKVNNSKNWYYVRRIPKDLHEHYADKKDKRIVESTKTSNKAEASRKALQINLKIESEWKAIQLIHQLCATTDLRLDYQKRCYPFKNANKSKLILTVL